jgi:hypothetical protein
MFLHNALIPGVETRQVRSSTKFAEAFARAFIGVWLRAAIAHTAIPAAMRRRPTAHE